MSRPAPARARTHSTLQLVVVSLVMAVVAILGTLVYQTASASVPGLGTVLGGAAADGDGALPEGATVADVEHAGIANLDPALLQALGDATADAAADGIRLQVNSGWRSAQRQDQLLQDAIDEHGSEAEAARWVATADTSPHVSGDAVDVGPAEAATWLSVHGAAHGLCRIYDNEPWHFELRPDAVGTGCPATYADPTQDPRMQP